MKATINGIEVQGTPEEIAAYVKLMDDMRRDGIHIKPPIGKMPDWLKGNKDQGGLAYTTITCGVGMKPLKTHVNDKCFAAMNGGCYCTGACHK